MLLGRKQIPHTRVEIQFELAKLARLREACAKGENDDFEILLRRIDRRIEVLQDHLTRQQARIQLLKSVAVTQRFKHMGKRHVEESIRERFSVIDFSHAKRCDLRKFATELQELIAQGEHLQADEVLLASAQVAMEECLSRLAVRNSIMQSAHTAFSRFAMGQRIMAVVLGEVQVKFQILEDNIRRILRECENWEERLSLEEMAQMKEELAVLIETAHIKYDDVINQELVAEAESLVDSISRYLLHIEERQNRLQDTNHRVEALLRKARCTSANDYIGVARTQLDKAMEELDKLAGAESAEVPDRHGVHAEVQQMRESYRSTIDISLKVLDKGPEYFALTKTDLRKGVPVGSLVPLQAALERMEEAEKGRPDSEGFKDIELLVNVLNRLMQYGYKSAEQAFVSITKKMAKCDADDQDESEITLQDFRHRLEQLGIIDIEVVSHLYSMLSPFHFSNFRRLLESPVIKNHIENH